MIYLYQWKSNVKAIENLSVTTKNALVGDGANQDNQNQRRMHQICEKSSPQMWANHVLHMRAIFKPANHVLLTAPDIPANAALMQAARQKV